MVDVEPRSLYRFLVALEFTSVGEKFACHPTDCALEYVLASVHSSVPYSNSLVAAKVSVGQDVDGITTKVMDSFLINLTEKGILEFSANLQPLQGTIVVDVECIDDGAVAAALPAGIEVDLSLYFITQSVK